MKTIEDANILNKWRYGAVETQLDNNNETK